MPFFRRKATIELCASAALILSFSTGLASPLTFTNPVREHAPDPWILYYGGSYYYMCTTGINLTIWKAHTLGDLKQNAGKVVWNPTGAYASLRDIWAPELHRIRGKWYIYFSADQNGQNATHRIYVLESRSRDPLVSTWTMKGKVSDPSDRWAIDATVLEKSQELYILWSGWPGDRDGVQNIYIARLKNPWTIDGNRVLLSTPEFEWERHDDATSADGNHHLLVNEAPEILRHEGKIFLVYSASACWTDSYELGMLTASANQDPLYPASWSKSKRPVFRGSPQAHAYGAGHNAFFKSPDDKQDWIIYHANYEPHQGCKNDRSSRAQPFAWNKDGTPNFGTPVLYGQRIPEPSGEYRPN